ncbi:hypothetical protein DTO006G1_6705 [Penicillium roqueforti]|uniref:uncharacterized protein n=1 Tax=Penicillium roqueforti TaxID=5082 RepID=UPI00190E5BF7|nr:uncharacterized protein LCP9604111_4264 [Penicillium roqueforti]KAF9249635.1 hypothetical protein LCP9604111_4264 [Penicillium roqueforti]KAI1835177.1 hypothetical protein CBS147337_3994 [Penicillium roqueforti]KAI2677190.1 hypothetical protein CBS147355_5417 [Penicillium roqueforti]KAI2688513.1 hypothetical protein LCP963914a_2915 [Penicillium roqueforti]KAI2700688.1 hypothetical protein CBS147372_5467 [Penicillium roqueforti]
MGASKISPEDIDTILSYIIPHIKQSITNQSTDPIKRPFVLALTGLQGSGKSTWTDALASALNNKHKYKTINLSLDDLYLDHNDLVKLRESNPMNKLLQTRGQPGTHDTALSVSFFRSLVDSEVISIPSFDKSLFNGEGGRVPSHEWDRLNTSDIDILIFEGWCVGFQSLAEEQVRLRWSESENSASENIYPTNTLKEHAIEHLLGVNASLQQYCELFMGPRHFDYLLHLDTDKLVNVYEWRVQQEHALRQQKGKGMTDAEVVRFVKGYMPAYELYLDQLRQGIFTDGKGKGQLRVVLDHERRIIAIDTVS